MIDNPKVKKRYGVEQAKRLDAKRIRMMKEENKKIWTLDEIMQQNYDFKRIQ